MKSSSILMSSFAALLILISVHKNALISTDFASLPNQTIPRVLPLEVINEAPFSPPILNALNIFSYMKFDVSDYPTAEVGNDDMPEVVDFPSLKFNVSDYSETDPEIGVLPEESNFDYLKFDVTGYTSSPSIEELPITDLSYLKFDVQEYIRNNSVVEINELPE